MCLSLPTSLATKVVTKQHCKLLLWRPIQGTVEWDEVRDYLWITHRTMKTKLGKKNTSKTFLIPGKYPVAYGCPLMLPDYFIAKQ